VNIDGGSDGIDVDIKGTGLLELVIGNFGFGLPNNLGGAGATVGNFDFGGVSEIDMVGPILS
jgi:hypothetical protein